MLLAQGHHPGTIAAISFTEASASELGKRIHSVVEELLAGGVPLELRAVLPEGLSAAQRNALTDAADHLDELTTTTIHSFCQQIIVDNAVEAGLDPGIKVADEMAADAMFDQAFSDWFSSALSSGNSVDRSVVVLAEDDPLEVGETCRTLRRSVGSTAWRSLRARTFPCGPSWNSRTPSTPLRAGSPTTRSTKRQTISSVASMCCAPTTTAPSPATWTSMRCGE